MKDALPKDHFTVYHLPLSLIKPPSILVRDIDGATVNDLRESIKIYGILQPILVNFIREKQYEIVFGNHRYYACKGLGIKTIPCFITEIDPKKALMLSLIENIQRLSLNPFREGKIYYKLLGEPKSSKGKPLLHKDVFVEQLSKQLGKSVYYIMSRVRLYLFFDPCLKDEIGKTLTLTNAIHLSKFTFKKQREIFQEIKNSRTSMNGQVLNPLTPPKHGASMPRSKTPYCYCPNCGSQHLKGVSVEGNYH